MLKSRQLGHIVTQAVTYKGHYFQIDEYAVDGTPEELRALGFDGTAAGQPTVAHASVRDRYSDAVILELIADVTLEPNGSGEVVRVAGTDADGVEHIWRVVKACARCASPSTYTTPAYDIPT